MKYLSYFEKNINSDDDIIIILYSYLETALCVESDNKDLEDRTIWDFSDESKEQAKSEIKWFLHNAGDVFYNVSFTTIGHDLWLTRNGHGSGFFDRDYNEDVLELLEDLSKELGEIYLYVGDDDEIYFDGGSGKYKKFDLDKYKKDKELKRDAKKYNL